MKTNTSFSLIRLVVHKIINIGRRKRSPTLWAAGHLHFGNTTCVRWLIRSCRLWFWENSKEKCIFVRCNIIWHSDLYWGLGYHFHCHNVRIPDIYISLILRNLGQVMQDKCPKTIYCYWNILKSTTWVVIGITLYN